MVISSASNEQIKRVILLREKAKVRKKEGCFLVEGIKMFMEAPKDEVVKVYVSENFMEENSNIVEDYNYQIVSDSVFKKLSDTVTPQGIMAVVKQKKYTMQNILDTLHAGQNCFVVLDRIQDPGNLGTIIRTGEGAGINGVIMSNTTVDIYNPKVIRSTMGSIYRVPFLIAEDLPGAVRTLKQAGITAYAAHLKGGPYNKEEFPNKTALLIGNEGNGLSDEVSGEADRLIKIPMKGQVESLNASIATAILMYQVLQ